MFKVNAPVGKSTTRKMGNVSNPFHGRKDNDSMRGKAGVGKGTTTANYAGKAAQTSSGFATSRARELSTFIGSVPVSGLRHTKKPDTRNKIN